MKFIKPSVELYPQEDYTLEGIYKQIEKCARISYKSESLMKGGSSKEFVDNLIKRGHLSPLEHGTVYLKREVDFNSEDFNTFDTWYEKNPYSKVNYAAGICYITTNFRVIVENKLSEHLRYICAPTEFHHKRYTVKAITDIGTTRELNRHRAFSITEMSTRYCNFSKNKFNGEITFIRPYWWNKYSEKLLDKEGYREDGTTDMFVSEKDFMETLQSAECAYMAAMTAGVKPQEARQLLPLATKTEVVYTAFEEDWEHFFRLRTSIFAETGAPHPDMAKLADELYYKFKELNYIKMD